MDIFITLHEMNFQALDAETIRLSGVYKLSEDINVFLSHVNYNRDGSKASGACKNDFYPLDKPWGVVGINGSALWNNECCRSSLTATIQANCNASIQS